MSVSWFRFTVPGQPPSWNRSYRITRRSVTKTDGSKVAYSTLSKTSATSRYQGDLRMIARAARPSEWSPVGPLIVVYEFFLKRDMDCDNVLKSLNDALADALGVNDRIFLPVVLSKSAHHKDPCVNVTVYDAAHWQVVIEEKIA